MIARNLRRYVGLLMTIILVGGLLSGCQLISGGTRVEAPTAEAAERVTNSSNALTFDLLAGLTERARGENVVISPLSVSALLAMLLTGAQGETAEAIASVMHLPGSSPDDAADFGQLLRYLADSSDDVELGIGNAVWANQGYPLTEEFVADIRDDFGGEVEELDLGSQQGADEIDEWVSDKTRGLIDKMSDALRLPDPQVVVVLMNAVYFKGSWTQPFEESRTHQGTFTKLDGTAVAVDMMTQVDEFEVTFDEEYTMLRLPYGESERFVMDVMLPSVDQDPTQFVLELDEEAWKAATESLAEGRVNVVMPRYELEYKATGELDELLQDLGMDIAYSPAADFSRMSPSSPWLSRVAHKTYIRVDEEGTEAAGVTGGAMVESMPASIELSRPFVFAISDTETHDILFAGFVTDPTK